MLESQQIPAHKRYFSAYARKRGWAEERLALFELRKRLARYMRRELFD